jgi:formylglycine-generating enzyme
MRILSWYIVVNAFVLMSSSAHAVVIDTVPVGNPGNAADTEIMSDGTTGYGDVPYEYRIGKYEVTNAQYAEFLNTKDPTGIDTLNLYLPSFCDRAQCGINFNAAAVDGAKYVVKPGRDDHPVTYVTWYAAIRFANWLHNGQGNGDTETGAYTLGPLASGDPLHGNNITRNVGAQWFLPSENEWYKAAYHKNDGVTGNYWDYAMQSNVAPTAAIPPGGANSANFNDVLGDVSPVGAYSHALGPYGTFDQAGNLGEWNEALLSPGQFDSDGIRGTRGASWFGGGTDVTESLAASSRPAGGCAHGGNMDCGGFALGFRVASVANPVPEPGTWLLLAAGTAIIALGRWRFRFSTVICVAGLFPSAAQAVVIDTVLVGNAGNAADTQIMSDGTTGYGDVPYEYRIGKYEVTNAQYAAFLNAVDPTGANALLLYSGGMSNRPEGGINFDAAASHGSKYSLKSGFGNRPVIQVSWYNALRFTNWLHNGQGSGDTENGAYMLMGMLNSSNDEAKGATITRNPGANWFLPSEDEWYKAAYHRNDGITGNYWDYPTGTDVAPTAEAPPGGDNSANFSGVIDTVSDVGAYTKSSSSYGTFDQGGNLYEWNESLTIKRDRFRDFYFRGLRGGGWFGEGSVNPQVVVASNRPAIGGEGGSNPGGQSIHWGFRVASAADPVPEPGSWLLLAAGTAIIALGGLRSRFPAVICAAALVPTAAHAVVIDTVLVGNAGNAADTQIMRDGTTGYGAVPYEYRIGKYEVTIAQYAEFLNTKDPTGIDTLHLYLPSFCDRVQCGINFDAAPVDGAKYVVNPATTGQIQWHQH